MGHSAHTAGEGTFSPYGFPILWPWPFFRPDATSERPADVPRKAAEEAPDARSRTEAPVGPSAGQRP